MIKKILNNLSKNLPKTLVELCCSGKGSGEEEEESEEDWLLLDQVRLRQVARAW
jgi:hypothetical protein